MGVDTGGAVVGGTVGAGFGVSVRTGAIVGVITGVAGGGGLAVGAGVDVGDRSQPANASKATRAMPAPIHQPASHRRVFRLKTLFLHGKPVCETVAGLYSVLCG